MLAIFRLARKFVVTPFRDHSVPVSCRGMHAAGGFSVAAPAASEQCCSAIDEGRTQRPALALCLGPAMATAQLPRSALFDALVPFGTISLDAALETAPLSCSLLLERLAQA
jgi:hypothetical protein